MILPPVSCRGFQQVWFLEERLVRHAILGGQAPAKENFEPWGTQSEAVSVGQSWLLVQIRPQLMAQ